MAFKDQYNLSKIEILLYKSNRYFLELLACLNILIRILQVSKLLLVESTYVTMHMLQLGIDKSYYPLQVSRANVASLELAQLTSILESHFFKVVLDVATSPVDGPWSLMQ